MKNYGDSSVSKTQLETVTNSTIEQINRVDQKQTTKIKRLEIIVGVLVIVTLLLAVFK